MSIRRIVPNIRSDRLPESQTFYQELFGLKLAMDMGWISTLESPTNPTAQLTIIQTPDSGTLHPDLTVEVSDVDAIHAAAVARGAKIVYPLTDEPWGVRRFFMMDPNGYVLNIMSHQQE